MSTTTTTTEASIEPTWASAWEGGRNIEKGDILRTKNGKHGYLYSIADGGGFGSRAGSTGNAIFVNNETRDLMDTVKGIRVNGVRWERHWGDIEYCTNADEIRKVAAEEGPVTYELMHDVPATDRVPDAGRFPAMLHNDEHGSMLVLSINEECEQPHAICLVKGRYEVYLRNVNGVYEISEQEACSKCMRPTEKGQVAGFSIAGDNRVTCKDCHTPKVDPTE